MSYIERAAEFIRAGKLVAFPTETVYGLGADATNPAAIQLLYSVKRRPAEHPVIAHIDSTEGLKRYGTGVSKSAETLAEKFWPGPLTILVHKREPGVVDQATGGLLTVGLRVPDHPIALSLIRSAGVPIAAPSANEFGKVSPTTAQHVASDIGTKVQMILDGGPCVVGVESTIVDCTRTVPLVVRLGGVSVEALSEALGSAPDIAHDGEVSAPGTLESHYSPRAHVQLVTDEDLDVRAKELLESGRSVAVIGPRSADVSGAFNLPVPTELDHYAHVLYDQLRQADLNGADCVLVVPPEAQGLGRAICDRLARAAAKP